MYLFFHPFGQISHVGYTSSTLIPFLHSFLSFFLSGIIAPLRTLFVTMLLVLPSIFPNLSYIFSSLITVLHSLLLFCSFKQYLLLYDHSLSFCYLFFHWICSNLPCSLYHFRMTALHSFLPFCSYLLYSYVWCVVDIFFLVCPKSLRNFFLIFIKSSFVILTILRISQLATVDHNF